MVLMVRANKVPDDFILDILQNASTCSKKERNKEQIIYYNIPASFDIEVTSWVENGEKKATMYIWMFDLDGIIVYGRTWEEYINWLNRIIKLKKPEVHIVIYVHNLSYEFQFICRMFEWETVFASKERRPIYARNEHFEYRCSYYLSGYSLATVARNLNTHKIEKLMGNLDYSIKRNSKTKLSEEEIAYCEHDVLILQYYIEEQIEQCGNIAKIPLTQTGFVRQDVKHRANAKDTRKKRYELISRCVLEPDVYNMAKAAYRGGFTHACAYKVNEIIENVGSIDFASSYPAVMFTETFPMSAAILVDPKDYENSLKKYHCIFTIEIEHLYSVEYTDHILSHSKCKEVTGFQLDNGRIVSAEHLITTVTEIEYDNLCKFYTWKSCTIIKMYAFAKGFLPKYMLEAISEYFRNKTMLKGIEGVEAEYMHAKQLLNSTYGMSVTDICRDTITFDGWDWVKEPVNVEETLNNYNKNPGRFLYYLWGIYVTAYATRNLMNGILEFGRDYIYSDTDSIKATNMDNHSEYIQTYNQNIINKVRKACIRNGWPENYMEPRDAKGKTRYLGIWEREDGYEKFKTLGAKRYAYIQNGKFGITIAGVNKQNGARYMVEKYGDGALEAFTADLCFPAEIEINGEKYSPSGKGILTYIDESISGYMTDYQGNQAYYDEQSFVHFSNGTYSLDMSDEYLDYLYTLRIIDPN